MSDVCLLNTHRLYDIGTEAWLAWRNQGSDWEPREGDDGDEENGNDEALRSTPRVMLEQLWQEAAAEDGPLQEDAAVSLAEGFVDNFITSLRENHLHRFEELSWEEENAVNHGIARAREVLVIRIAQQLQATGYLSAEDVRRIIEEFPALLEGEHFRGSQ